MVGGVCINTGTIPSKTLREAVLYLTGLSQREHVRRRATGSRTTSPIADLLAAHRSTSSAARSTSSATSCSATASTCCTAPARFVDPHTVARRRRRPRRPDTVTAEQDRHRRRHPAGPAAQRRVRRPSASSTPTAILSLERVPALHGRRRRRRHRHRVRLDVRRARHQGHGGRAARPRCSSSATTRSSRRSSTTCATWPSPSASARRSRRSSVTPRGTVTVLVSGKRIAADTVMYSAGRQGVTDELEPGRGRPDRRRPRPAQGRRVLPDRGRRTSTRSAT